MYMHMDVFGDWKIHQKSSYSSRQLTDTMCNIRKIELVLVKLTSRVSKLKYESCAK